MFKFTECYAGFGYSGLAFSVHVFILKQKNKHKQTPGYWNDVKVNNKLLWGVIILFLIISPQGVQ